MTQPVPDYMLPDEEPAEDAPAPDVTGRVPVRAPDGTVGTIDASEMQAAATRGFTPLDAHELEVERVRPAGESALGMAASAGIGVGNAATLGLGIPAFVEGARLVGGDALADESRHAIGLSQEVNPGVNLAGEIGGMLTPGGLAGALGKGAAKVGGMAAARLAPGAATLGARVAQAGIRGAVSGLIEGAAQGAGQQLTEDALGDHETTAEKLFASAAKGGLIGGFVGGGMSGAGQLIAEGAGAAARKFKPTAVLTDEEAKLGTVESDLADWDEKFAASAKAEPVGSGLAGQMPKRNAVDSMADTYISRISDPETRAAAKAQYEARRVLGTVDDSLNATVKRTTAAGDEFLESQQAMRKAVFGENKAKKLAEIIDVPDPERGLGAMFKVRDDLRGVVKMLDETVQGEGRVGIRKVTDALDTFDKKMIGTAKLGASNLDNLKAGYVLMDQVKQAIGRSAGMGRESRNEVQAEMFKIYETLRVHLEDASLFGNGAVAQREMNKATTEMLQRGQGARSAFIDATESVGGDTVLRADPMKMKAFLNGALDEGYALQRESVERFIQGHENQIAAARAHWPMTPAEAAHLAKGEEAIKKFRASMAQAAEESKVAITAKRKLEEESSRALGGVVGMVADIATSPMRTMQRLADMARTTGRVTKTIDEGVEGFFAGGAHSAPVRTPASKAEAQAVAKDVTQLAANPSAMLDRISKTFAGISEAAPKVASYLGSTAARGISYLAANAPKSHAPYATLTPQFVEPRFSDSDVAAFARRYEAWKDPHTVLDDLKRGAVTREGVETLRECYPKLYLQVQEAAMKHLAASKRPLPYEQRIQLGVLLGIPADPTLDAAFVAKMQSSKMPAAQAPSQAQAAQAQSSGRHGRPIATTGYQTEAERIEAGQ